MSNKSRAVATRAGKRNKVKTERQKGDQAVRDAVNAMHAEMAEAAAEAAKDDQDELEGDDAND